MPSLILFACHPSCATKRNTTTAEASWSLCRLHPSWCTAVMSMRSPVRYGDKTHVFNTDFHQIHFYWHGFWNVFSWNTKRIWCGWEALVASCMTPQRWSMSATSPNKGYVFPLYQFHSFLCHETNQSVITIFYFYFFHFYFYRWTIQWTLRRTLPTSPWSSTHQSTSVSLSWRHTWATWVIFLTFNEQSNIAAFRWQI